MKSSNLAARLEQFEAVMDSLRRTSEHVTRVRVGLAEANRAEALPARPARRSRTRGIQLRDQGLRAFRVR
jgi:hypothetical protein